jgi:hypothetical protein
MASITLPPRPSSPVQFPQPEPQRSSGPMAAVVDRVLAQLCIPRRVAACQN